MCHHGGPSMGVTSTARAGGGTRALRSVLALLPVQGPCPGPRVGWGFAADCLAVMAGGAPGLLLFPLVVPPVPVPEHGAQWLCLLADHHGFKHHQAGTE